MHLLGEESHEAKKASTGSLTRGYPILILTPAAPLMITAITHARVQRPCAGARVRFPATGGDLISLPVLGPPDLPNRAGTAHQDASGPPRARGPPPSARRRRGVEVLRRLPPGVAPRAGGAARPAAGSRRRRPGGAAGGSTPREGPDVDIKLGDGAPVSALPILAPLLLLGRLLLPDTENVLPPLRPRGRGAGDGGRELDGGRRARRRGRRIRLRLRFGTTKRGVGFGVEVRSKGEMVEREENPVGEELVSSEERRRGVA